VKTIRKVFIIYQNKLRKLKVNKFLNWRLTTHKLKLLRNKNSNLNTNSPQKIIETENNPNPNSNTNSNVYIKKKSHDMPLNISEAEKNNLRKNSKNFPNSKNLKSCDNEVEEELINPINPINQIPIPIPSLNIHVMNINPTNSNTRNNKPVKYNFEETETNRGNDSKKVSIRENFFSEGEKNKNKNKNNSLDKNSREENEKIFEVKIDKKEENSQNSPPLPIHEKLYQDKKRRDIIQTELEKNFRYEEIKHCTFTPKINTSKNKTKNPIDIKNNFSPQNHSPPHYLQLYEKSKKKEDKLRLLNLEKEKTMRELYTFEPVVNPKYKLTKFSEDFYDRLRSYSSCKTQRMNKIKEDLEKSFPVPYPKVNRDHSINTTTNLLKNSHSGSILNISSVNDRSVDYHRKKQEKIKKIKDDMCKEQGITFKPRLNESINMNINSSLIERNEDFMQRKFIKLTNLQSRDGTECTFSPKVNKTMKTIADEEGMKVGDRLYQYQQKYQKKLEEKIEIYKQENEGNYSFKPEINNNTYEILKQREMMMEEIKNKINEERQREREREMKVENSEGDADAGDNINININNINSNSEAMMIQFNSFGPSSQRENNENLQKNEKNENLENFTKNSKNFENFENFESNCDTVKIIDISSSIKESRATLGENNFSSSKFGSKASKASKGSNNNIRYDESEKSLRNSKGEISATTSINLSNNLINKKTHNHNKYKVNPHSLQNVSDSKLLEMANQYITTDESLEKFQSRLKEKNSTFVMSKINDRERGVSSNEKTEKLLLDNKNNISNSNVLSNNKEILSSVQCQKESKIGLAPNKTFNQVVTSHVHMQQGKI
jgi:hypothetical protein